MKILFISIGDSGKVGVVVRRQAGSLIKQEVEIDFYLVKGTGLLGYIKNIRALNKEIRKGSYNLIRAH